MAIHFPCFSPFVILMDSRLRGNDIKYTPLHKPIPTLTKETKEAKEAMLYPCCFSFPLCLPSFTYFVVFIIPTHPFTLHTHYLLRHTHAGRYPQHEVFMNFKLQDKLKQNNLKYNYFVLPLLQFLWIAAQRLQDEERWIPVFTGMT
ncbi:MAG: hypothetical protein LBG21_00475 [Campylobacteraceae bacterium]|jgi:hypothetical protein|nr:hypothetical protein [Campylobacteraceae bacterium]